MQRWALLLSLIPSLTACADDDGSDGTSDSLDDQGGLEGADPNVDSEDVLVDGDEPGNGGGTSGGEDGCAPNFTGLVRDFRRSHPDFEAFSGRDISVGIVRDELGDDQKPVYNADSPFMTEVDGELAYVHDDHGQQTTSEMHFDQWYRTVEGVNQEFEYTLPLDGNNGGRLVFDSSAFFPIDGRGFGNEGNAHNFLFTFELHTEFTYEGGEVFTFTGDDDLWAFINGKLAVDVGGLHPARSATVELDAEAERLGIEIGETYPLDLFHAERHTDQSNFRIETNIVFTNCDAIFVGPDVR
jgi:fibro-slime domain-containing protein